MKPITNRKARYEFALEDTFEAGMMLLGSEVKSLRAGQASLNEAYAIETDGKIFLTNMSISPYPGANKFNHELRRPRQLLLRKKEIEKITGSLSKKRMTLVPLEIYFNERGIAKCKIALAKGKTTVDKRQTIKERDWSRNKARVLRGE